MPNVDMSKLEHEDVRISEEEVGYFFFYKMFRIFLNTGFSKVEERLKASTMLHSPTHQVKQQFQLKFLSSLVCSMHI